MRRDRIDAYNFVGIVEEEVWMQVHDDEEDDTSIQQVIGQVIYEEPMRKEQITRRYVSRNEAL